MIPDNLERSVIAMQHVVGSNVRQFRLAIGLSEGQLADRVGCDTSFVIQVEDGRTDIEIDVLVRLADALQTAVHVLVDPDAGMAQPQDAAT